MSDSDVDWMFEVLRKLQSPDAELLKDLMGCIARVRELQGLEPALWPKGLSALAAEPASEILRRRTALYLRLRESWSRVKDSPICLKQCQLLKETCNLSIGSDILTDPIAEEPVPLTLERAKEYGHKALEIAEQLGDLAEAGDICIALTHHYKMSADYERAIEYCNKAFALGRQTGSLSLQLRSCHTRYELLTLNEAPVEQLIQCKKELIDVVEKEGDFNFLLGSRCVLAKLLVLSGNYEEGKQELERIYALLQRVSVKNASTVSAYCFYYALQSILNYEQGEFDVAISHQKQATLANARNPHYREDFLWNDLAWLETLCRKAGRDEEFRDFCRELKGVSKLEQFYLAKGIPERVAWNEEERFNDFPANWEWIDPLGKGSYRIEDGFEITPVMGAGVYVNVYTPRLMREIEGDFVIETVLDYKNGFTRAGGILVYQDDETLIRFGTGIQADGEVTLTVKSPAQGFFIIARGLLEAENLYLRLERRGDCFRAWCGNGAEWYRGGQAVVKMRERVEVGIFAECTYRVFSLVRCTATPLRFREVKIEKT